MADHYYDRYGNHIGTRKSEEEKRQDEQDQLIGAIEGGGILLKFIGYYLAIGCCGIWIVTIIQLLQGESLFPYAVWYLVSIILITIPLGIKIVTDGYRKEWEAIWVALAGFASGFLGGLLAHCILSHSLELDELIEIVFTSAMYTVLPTVIVVWRIRKKNKGKRE